MDVPGYPLVRTAGDVELAIVQHFPPDQAPPVTFDYLVTATLFHSLVLSFSS